MYVAPRSLAAALVAASLASVAAFGVAQETPKATESAKTPAAKAEATAKDAKGESANGGKKSTRRLPPHVGKVIDGLQREKIYKVMDAHQKDIADLEAKLEAAKKRRDDEVMSLLTEEQRQRVKEYEAESAKK